MGGICDHPSDQNILYTTKSLPDTYTNFKTPRFYFSTQPLSKLDAQCLLIITNDALNLQKNIFIKKMLNKTVSDRIISQYKISLKGRKLKQRQHLIFSLSIVGLDYTKICILYFPEQEVHQIFEQGNQQQIKQNFVGGLENCMKTIKQSNITSLVVTEFSWKSWVYKSTGFRQLSKIIIKFNFFKAVVFSCLSEESQSLAMKVVQEINNNG